ncbi:MAG: hypothetical protein ACRD1V_19115 [Vicinamibacterales bacterium]
MFFPADFHPRVVGRGVVDPIEAPPACRFVELVLRIERRVSVHASARFRIVLVRVAIAPAEGVVMPQRVAVWLRRVSAGLIRLSAIRIHQLTN